MNVVIDRVEFDISIEGSKDGVKVLADVINNILHNLQGTQHLKLKYTYSKAYVNFAHLQHS